MSTKPSYRCSLSHMVDLMKDIRKKVTNKHKEEFKKTPFASLFNMFYEKTWVTKDSVMGLHDGITEIIQCYSERKEGFNIGQVILKFKPSDVAVIFGLKMEGKEVEAFSGTTDKSCRKTEFFRNYFEDSNAIFKSTIERKIKEVVGIVGKEEDFVKLTILLMSCTFLFTATSGTEIQSSFVEHLKDYNTINAISWPKTIHKYMMHMTKRQVQGKNKAAGGCPILFLYWIAEHSDIVDPVNDSETRLPRAARWNLKEVATIVPERIMMLVRGNISLDLRDLQEEELRLLGIGGKEMVDQKQVGNDVMGKNKMLEEEYNQLRQKLTEEVEKNQQLEEINRELLARIAALQDFKKKQPQELGLKEELLQKAKEEIELMKGEGYILPAATNILEEIERDIKMDDMDCGLNEAGMNDVLESLLEMKKGTNEELQEVEIDDEPKDEKMKEGINEQTNGEKSWVKRMNQKARREKKYDNESIVGLPAPKKQKKLATKARK